MGWKTGDAVDLRRRRCVADLLGGGLLAGGMPGGRLMAADAGAAVPADAQPWHRPLSAEGLQRAQAALQATRWSAPARQPGGWWEWRLPDTLGPSGPQRFDAACIDLRCDFTGPGDRRLRVTGFWSEDGQGPHWALRLLPPVAGRWQGQVRVRLGSTGKHVEAGALALEVGAVPARQRITVDAHHPRYFAFDDGTPFVPVGLNICWGGSRQPLDDYRRWFTRFAVQGGNFARLWMASWCFGLEWQDTGLGDYSRRMDRAAQLDAVFALAESLGIRLMLCLVNHGAFTEKNDAEWAHNPYNRALGGPLAAPEDFVTDEQAIALFERRVRYIAARWSHSPALHSWEWWNEVNWTPIAAAALRPWFKRLGQVLDAHDPYRRLRSTSWADRGDPAAWRGGALDYAQQHDYTARDPMLHYAGAARDWRHDGITQLPLVPGELGLETAYDPKQPRPFDADAVHLHNGLWAPLFQGFASTALYWWWDHMVDPQDVWPAYRGVARWLDTLHGQGLHLGQHQPHPVGFIGQREAAAGSAGTAARREAASDMHRNTGPEAGALALAGARSLLAWVRADRHDAGALRRAWREETGGTEPARPWQPVFPPIDGGTLHLKGLALPDGPVQARWFDTHTGEPAGRTEARVQGGVLVLPCPSFTRGLAAIVRPPADFLA